MQGGTAFCEGRRAGPIELRRWIMQHSMVVDKNRFDSRELCARDFLMALGVPSAGSSAAQPDSGCTPPTPCAWQSRWG